MVTLTRRLPGIPLIGALAGMAFLTGCAALWNTSDYYKMNEHNVSALPDERLCVGVGYVRDDVDRGFPRDKLSLFVDEMTERGMLRDRHLRAVMNERIRIGMNRCEVFASWGRPRDINRTTSRYGSREQWVYRCSNCYDGNYVYFEGGEVTTVQN